MANKRRITTESKQGKNVHAIITAYWALGNSTSWHKLVSVFRSHLSAGICNVNEDYLEQVKHMDHAPTMQESCNIMTKASDMAHKRDNLRRKIRKQVATYSSDEISLMKEAIAERDKQQIAIQF